MKNLLVFLLITLMAVSTFGQTKITTNEAIKLSIGPLVNITDGTTPENSIDVTDLTVEGILSYDGDTEPIKQFTFSPTVEDGGTNDMWLIDSGGASVLGMYLLEVTAAQLNATGKLTIIIFDTAGGDAAVAVIWWKDYLLCESTIVDKEHSEGVSNANLISINDVGTQLEQFMDFTTGKAADDNLTSVIADGSVLSHLMTPAADTSTYNASTDSWMAMAAELAKVPKSDGTVSWNITALAALASEVWTASDTSANTAAGTMGRRASRKSRR